MSTTDRVAELLRQYQELRQQGESVTPEELCRDCPELLERLNRNIEMGRLMDSLLTEPPGTDAAAVTQPITAAQGGDTAPSAYVPQSHYRVLHAHAAGGLGEVLVARDDELGREVAV